MSPWLQIAIGGAAGLILLWVLLVGVLWLQQRRAGRSTDWRAVARLAPDLLRLIKRLSTDRDVPRGTRWWLFGLLVYLVLPLDLVPDVLPVIGYADDAIVIVVALRFAMRHAGHAALRRNWTGTPEGLASVLALARVSIPPEGDGQ